MVEKVQNNDLKKALEADVAVLDFNATWCGPCRMVAPIVEQMAEENAGKIEFYSIDCDENPNLAHQFGVMSIPSIFVLKKGKVVANTVGFRPKAQMDAWLKESL